jgi:hypothetical protein
MLLKLTLLALMLLPLNGRDQDMLIGKWRFFSIDQRLGTEEKERQVFYKDMLNGAYFYFDGRYHGKVSNGDTLFNVPYYTDKQKLIVNNNAVNIFTFRTRDTLILFDVNTEEELKLIRKSE